MLEDNKYLSGSSKATIADISAAADFAQLAFLPDFERYLLENQRVAMWYNRVMDIEGVEKAHKDFFALVKKSHEKIEAPHYERR
jgi:hypothetical protein